MSKKEQIPQDKLNLLQKIKYKCFQTILKARCIWTELVENDSGDCVTVFLYYPVNPCKSCGTEIRQQLILALQKKYSIEIIKVLKEEKSCCELMAGLKKSISLKELKKQ